MLTMMTNYRCFSRSLNAEAPAMLPRQLSSSAKREGNGSSDIPRGELFSSAPVILRKSASRPNSAPHCRRSRPVASFHLCSGVVIMADGSAIE